MSTVLETELQTYAEHRDTLLSQHEGEFVLIHGTDVLGTYETQMDTIAIGYERLGNVAFLVRRVERTEVPVCLTSGLRVRRP